MKINLTIALLLFQIFHSNAFAGSKICSSAARDIVLEEHYTESGIASSCINSTAILKVGSRTFKWRPGCDPLGIIAADERIISADENGQAIDIVLTIGHAQQFLDSDAENNADPCIVRNDTVEKMTVKILDGSTEIFSKYLICETEIFVCAA